MGRCKFGKMGINKIFERGEIYLVSLDPAIGSEINKTRPALIISNNINNQFSETVTVIPITSTTEKIYPFETFIRSGESGLSKDSKVKCNQIRTLDKKRLIKLLGKVPLYKLKEIENALLVHLEIQRTGV